MSTNRELCTLYYRKKKTIGNKVRCRSVLIWTVPCTTTWFETVKRESNQVVHVKREQF